MSLTFQDYLKMKEYIDSVIDFKCDTAGVLGSGMHDVVNEMEIVKEIPYSDIPKLPVCTNKAHSGKLVFAKLNGKNLILLDGRIHYYEGYPIQETVALIRLLVVLGVKKLLLTNAAGIVNTNFHVGDIMMIEDHISFLVPSPLIGKNIDEFGVRFPDMSNVYNEELTNKIYENAKSLNLPIQKGVYTQFSGPQFESKAEIKALRGFGTDAVGMSTVIEAIVANHAKVKVCGFSFLSNFAAGILKSPITDEEVIENAKINGKNLKTMFLMDLNTLLEA